MGKIIKETHVQEVMSNLHEQNKRLVLVGGCFDILHIGHITFLEKAKEQGDVLIILLEADATITKMKGAHRPINSQKDRGIVLSALSQVDYIIPLKAHLTNTDYDTIVTTIKPAIIATTAGDSYKFHKERQAKNVGATVVDVTTQIKDQSTTRLFAILSEI